MDTGIFDIEVAEQSSLWVAELENEDSSESEEYGIETFVYTTSNRFDETRLIDALVQGLPENIFRSKGLLAIAGSNDAFLWSQAGKFLRFNQIGQFAHPDQIKSEIVFIGQKLDRDQIKQQLHSAETLSTTPGI
jgi:G3E family GTPase